MRSTRVPSAAACAQDGVWRDGAGQRQFVCTESEAEFFNCINTNGSMFTVSGYKNSTGYTLPRTYLVGASDSPIGAYSVTMSLDGKMLTVKNVATGAVADVWTKMH